MKTTTRVRYENTYSVALQVKCPKCGAKPGQLCTTKSGGFASTAHSQRRAAAGVDAYVCPKRQKKIKEQRALIRKVRNYCVRNNVLTSALSSESGVNVSTAREILQGPPKDYHMFTKTEERLSDWLEAVTKLEKEGQPIHEPVRENPNPSYDARGWTTDDLLAGAMNSHNPGSELRKLICSLREELEIPTNSTYQYGDLITTVRDLQEIKKQRKLVIASERELHRTREAARFTEASLEEARTELAESNNKPQMELDLTEPDADLATVVRLQQEVAKRDALIKRMLPLLEPHYATSFLINELLVGGE